MQPFGMITTRVQPPVGDSFTCQGNPAIEVTVELDAFASGDIIDGRRSGGRE